MSSKPPLITKEIIVLGDVEMGGGTITDDFISDQILANFIRELSRRPHPIDLVFNGDTFDFLKCPSEINPQHLYSRHITAEISLRKLHFIRRAHARVFSALKRLLKETNKTVYFIPGNHDPDIAFPEVQRKIQKILGNRSRVKFPDQCYQDREVHVEHGHYYDSLFSVDPAKLFTNHNGSTILNLPSTSSAIISTLLSLKEEHPFLERIYPRSPVWEHHPVITKKFRQSFLSYSLKAMFYYPLRFYDDPTYGFPSEVLPEMYRRARQWHWETESLAPKILAQKKIIQKIVVLGHIHTRSTMVKGPRVIIHPGSWRDEYDFQPQTRELIPRSKRYVQIVQSASSSTYNIIDLPLQRKRVRFDEVIENEKKFIQQAARQEGFSAPLQ